MNNTEAKFKLLNLEETSCFPIHQADDASTKDSNHKSADLIGSNDYLLTEILHRLPSKSILRFESVSKQWLSLLTHPRFTLLSNKLLKSPGLYYNKLHVSFDVESPTTPPFSSLEFYPHIRDLDYHDIDYIRIVQSCNGLLLCCYYGCGDKYFVFNPTTKKIAVIPPVMGAPSVRIRLMGLAYHPTECVHYKLVCILRVGAVPFSGYTEDGYRMYYIQIYSSETGKWKKLSQTFTPQCYPYFRYGVYWNGAFHWAPCCSNPMYLSLDNEEIQDLPLPETVKICSWNYSYMPLYFGESRGYLHLVDSSHEKKPLSINVYEMLSDHSGWFIKYQVDLSELSVPYPNMSYNKWQFDKHEFRVLDVVRGEEEQEDTFLVVKALNNIKRYNIMDQSFQQLLSIPDIEEFRHEVEAYRYIEKIGSF